jgi:hypothetical protein
MVIVGVSAAEVDQPFYTESEEEHPLIPISADRQSGDSSLEDISINVKRWEHMFKVLHLGACIG